MISLKSPVKSGTGSSITYPPLLFYDELLLFNAYSIVLVELMFEGTWPEAAVDVVAGSGRFTTILNRQVLDWIKSGGHLATTLTE